MCLLWAVVWLYNQRVTLLMEILYQYHQVLPPSLRPWVGYCLLGIMWIWYHTLDMWHDIVLVLNLKLILTPMAITVSFKAAPVSRLLTETCMAHGIGLPRRFCSRSRASYMKSCQWLPGVGEKGARKEGSAEGGEELGRSPCLPAG